ncbi:MAG: alanine--tRNA ligase [Elusimicrobiota bacterium]
MSDLREKFLTYFDHKGHHINASTPLIPEGDPSLLFTAAGMVPFKPYFLGIKKGTDRAASCQKCFRTSDVDRVGMTLRHLTFFEMLGNFSFGDYFKEDAIRFAWDFLTNVAGLDPKRLHPTVFTDDDEAEELWRKTGTVNLVKRLGEESNFWAMGETGPCGPCSEIYYDLGPQIGSGPEDVIGGEGDRYIEVWNLVFMQFDRQQDGRLVPLPKKNIDTGMGLERLAMIVEDKKDPFHTSLFAPVRDAAAGFLERSSGDGKALPERERELAYRIISDHTRAAVMLAFEGVIPSNVERGYVLRRLIRRASRYGRLLGANEPFLHLLAPSAIEIFRKPYPELAEARSQIEDTLRAEEERFLETLEKGERELEGILERHPKALAGEQAFKLYDTYGFPLELTREICVRRGVTVDQEGFDKAQEAAVEKARAGWKGSGESSGDVYDEVLQRNPGMRSEFVGFQKLEALTQIACVIRHRETQQGKQLLSGTGQELCPGDEGEVILTRTPFYPEGGGQIGDSGVILDDIKEDKKLAEVHDTQKPRPDLIVHRVTAHRTIRPNMRVRARVDADKRRTTAYHHTATHLLNHALRRVLGPSVRQAGSLVAHDRLRFDFTHNKPLKKDEIAEVQRIVNEAIEKDIPVSARLQPIEEAARLKPITLLGEKYGEKPRFLLIGAKGWDDPMDRFSLELCGGTHVERTGQIRTFKIVKESSVAAGIRRIEAVAGPALEELKRQEERELRESLKEATRRFVEVTSKIQSVTEKPFRDPMLKDLPDPETAPLADIRKVMPEIKDLEKKLRAQLEQLKREKLLKQAMLGQVLLEIDGLKMAVQKFDQVEPQTLRLLTDRLKRELGSGVVFLASTEHKRLSFVVGVTQDLVGKGFDASLIAKAIAEIQNGRGGGRKDFAQGGGPNHDWEELVNKVKELIKAARSGSS